MDSFINLSARTHSSINIAINYIASRQAGAFDVNSHILRLLSNFNGRSAANAIIPRLIDIYRTSYWDHTPTTVPELWRSSQKEDINKIRRRDYLWKMCFEIIKSKKVCVSGISKRKIISAIGSDANPILFDSYWFFAAGHIITLSETIECIREVHGIYIFILLVNKNMLLFPEIVHMLEKLSPDIAVVYSNEHSFNLSSVKEEYHSLSFLDQDPLALTKHSKLVTTLDSSSLNPNLSMNPKLRGELPKRILNIDSLWNQTYSTNDSMVIINRTLNEKGRRLKHKAFIVYHARNSSFRFPSIRDSPSIMERRKLCELLDTAEVSVVNIGIIDEEVAAWDHPNVVHLGELGPIHSSVQLHAFNAAVAVVGSASGMTLISRLVNTPCLWIDLPYPCLGWPPASGHKILLKRLRRSKTFESPLRYFQITPDCYGISDHPNDHPLVIEGYELLPNSDVQIFNALCELTKHSCYKKVDRIAGMPDIVGELLGSDMTCMTDVALIEDAILAYQEFCGNGFRYIESISSLAW